MCRHQSVGGVQDVILDSEADGGGGGGLADGRGSGLETVCTESDFALGDGELDGDITTKIENGQNPQISLLVNNKHEVVHTGHHHSQYHRQDDPQHRHPLAQYRDGGRRVTGTTIRLLEALGVLRSDCCSGQDVGRGGAGCSEGPEEPPGHQTRQQEQPPWTQHPEGDDDGDVYYSFSCCHLSRPTAGIM